MSIDEKIRYGMMALTVSSAIVMTLGLYVSPLGEVAGGAGL